MNFLLHESLFHTIFVKNEKKNSVHGMLSTTQSTFILAEIPTNENSQNIKLNVLVKSVLDIYLRYVIVSLFTHSEPEGFGLKPSADVTTYTLISS